MLHITDKDFLEKFRYLQSGLRDKWKCIEGDESDTSDVDILVIPSLSLDQRELKKVEGYEHYEERLLFSLIRLWNPRNRLIYVTSVPLHPSIIDYYLQSVTGNSFLSCSQSLTTAFYLRFFAQTSESKDFRTSPVITAYSTSFKNR